jgi:type VI secretion system protein ImpK
VERSIGVFGEEMLLWLCALRQSPRRPPAEHVHRQANLLLDELKGSKAAQELPVQTVDDGMFAIAALLDEFAMALPDLRQVWASHPLQATRWLTHNAGVELFTRLERVRQGPKNVLATYAVVIGMGFQGKYGLPGADKYQIVQLRKDLGLQLGVDLDRDWSGGVLKSSKLDPDAPIGPKEPWFKSLWFGRGIAITLAVAALITLTVILVRNLG